jgi:glucose/arabinose dehydrogenase
MNLRALSRLALSCTVVAGATACLGTQSDYESELYSYKVVTVAEGLQNPWSTVFLPDGDLLITERPGRLRVVRDGQLLPEPVPGVPAVRAEGQGGLMEIVLHPDFDSNRLIYMSIAKPDEDGSRSTTSIQRARYEDDALEGLEEIFEADAWSSTAGHYGGKLAFDADGYLWITVGDRQAPPSLEGAMSHPAQNPMNHQGTILRLHDDGSVPEDNPFVGSQEALPEIWSYGHRNLQGLAIHPETGQIWQTEHGPQGGDELNLALATRNYGWPVIGYGVNYGGGVIHEGTRKEGMEQPVHYWVPSIGTSGLMIYTGDQFPAWRGSFFAGGLAGGYIERLTIDGTRVTGTERIVEGIGRVRDIKQGPDGLIYVVLDDVGSLVRLEPA